MCAVSVPFIFRNFYQRPQMAKGLQTCCIRTPKRIETNCDTRSFSNFDSLQHPNLAFPDRDSYLNSDQFAVLHNILSVVGVYFGTLCILTQTSIFTLCILWNSLPGPHKTCRRTAGGPRAYNYPPAVQSTSTLWCLIHIQILIILYSLIQAFPLCLSWLLCYRTRNQIKTLELHVHRQTFIWWIDNLYCCTL